MLQIQENDSAASLKKAWLKGFPGLDIIRSYMAERVLSKRAEKELQAEMRRLTHAFDSAAGKVSENPKLAPTYSAVLRSYDDLLSELKKGTTKGMQAFIAITSLLECVSNPKSTLEEKKEKIAEWAKYEKNIVNFDSQSVRKKFQLNGWLTLLLSSTSMIFAIMAIVIIATSPISSWIIPLFAATAVLLGGALYGFARAYSYFWEAARYLSPSEIIKRDLGLAEKTELDGEYIEALTHYIKTEARDPALKETVKELKALLEKTPFIEGPIKAELESLLNQLLLTQTSEKKEGFAKFERLKELLTIWRNDGGTSPETNNLIWLLHESNILNKNQKDDLKKMFGSAERLEENAPEEVKGVQYSDMLGTLSGQEAIDNQGQPSPLVSEVDQSSHSPIEGLIKHALISNVESEIVWSLERLLSPERLSQKEFKEVMEHLNELYKWAKKENRQEIVKLIESLHEDNQLHQKSSILTKDQVEQLKQAFDPSATAAAKRFINAVCVGGLNPAFYDTNPSSSQEKEVEMESMSSSSCQP
ncbi:MAG: hypothetical protein K0Q74_1067 [Gammaproteobacteria bacterium]|jgi:hypothetical protein|nr:hypothetical protein [Gammaproteobacteria bacterium]